MDNNSELLAQIGATETKRAKLTLGWRGATTRPPDVRFVEERPGPVVRMDPWTKPDPVDLCLELWKNWMAGDSDRPRRQYDARPDREGDGRGLDPHEAQQANDIRVAQATNAAIDSMVRLHVWAILPRSQRDHRMALPECVAGRRGCSGARRINNEAAEKHLHFRNVLNRGKKV